MERWPSVASANLWSWWKEKGGGKKKVAGTFSASQFRLAVVSD